MSNFATGCIPDKIDERDFSYDHLALGSAPFDWEVGYDIEEEIGFSVPPKHQGSSFSCVGQASSALAYVKNAVELLPVFKEETKEFVDELSAKSIYSLISLGENRGAYLRDGVKTIVSRGINKEKDVKSYQDDKPPTEKFMLEKNWQTSLMDEKAKNFQGEEYRVIHAKNIDIFAQAIRDNHGLLAGFNGSNNGTWYSEFPVPPAITEWSHAMYAGKARMIYGKKYIGCLNSWGTNAGKNGWQWFGEEWFEKGNVFNPWVLVDKRNLDLIWLLDRNGKPRAFPVYMVKTIRYLIELRNFKFKV
jgi:hypothetical protein